MIERKHDKSLPAGRFAGAVSLRYARELHSYLLRRLRRSQDVDDLAQEVYLRLLRIDESKAVHKPLAFLYGVAAHVVADFRIDTCTERQRLTFDDGAVDEWSERPSSPPADEMADRLALQQQLQWALAQLPPMHAAVLLAHKRDGLSYEEVARKLKLSVHTVEKYLTQARAKMRTLPWDR